MTAQYLFGELAWEGVSGGFAISVSIVEVSAIFEEDSGNIVILGERDGGMKRSSMDNVG
jgi:hypothetical protein